MDPTYFKSAETGAMVGIQEEKQWQIRDVTRVGREEKQINAGTEERDRLWKRTRLPLSPPVVRTEDRAKS